MQPKDGVSPKRRKTNFNIIYKAKKYNLAVEKKRKKILRQTLMTLDLLN